MEEQYLMPRAIIISNQSEYRGYKIKDNKEYNKFQLNIIVDSIEYFHYRSIVEPNSNYVIFEATINVEETTISEWYQPTDYDDGTELQSFNPSDLKKVLPADQFFYRWTREFKTNHGTGMHYHLMIIANHFGSSHLQPLQQQLEALDGVKSVFISPRWNYDFPKQHFHRLSERGEHGLEDAIDRYSYRAKIDQKMASDKRSFDGSRKLKPLLPYSMKLANNHASQQKRKIAQSSNVSLCN